MAAKSKSKRPQAEALAPIALDEHDERLLESVRDMMWLRDPNDAAVQCIRMATAAIAKQPGIGKRFVRDIGGAWSDGRKRLFRLMPRERDALDSLGERLGCSNRAEAMRLAIRIGEHWAARTIGRR